MTKPSVGRIVLVTGGPAKSNGTDVAPGLVTRVWQDGVEGHHDGVIDVTVFPDAGTPVAATSVYLYEIEDTARAMVEKGASVAAFWPARVS